MEKVRYMISDAANIVHVESHVLRYWEDELELNIPRNEMGHRYYTKENIAEFQRSRSRYNRSRHSRQQSHSRCSNPCSNPCSRCSPLHPSSFR